MQVGVDLLLQLGQFTAELAQLFMRSQAGIAGGLQTLDACLEARQGDARKPIDDLHWTWQQLDGRDRWVFSRGGRASQRCWQQARRNAGSRWNRRRLLAWCRVAGKSTPLGIDRKITSRFSFPSPYPLPEGEGLAEKLFFGRSLAARRKRLSEARWSAARQLPGVAPENGHGSEIGSRNSTMSLGRLFMLLGHHHLD